MKIEKNEKFVRLNFQKDKVILKEGTLGDAVYIIIEGKVEIRLGQFGKNPKTLVTRTRGDVIGEMALLDGKSHSASVVAVEDTVVNAMSPDEFRRRIGKLDPFMRGIMKMLVSRLRDATDYFRESKVEVNWIDWKR